MHRIILLLTLIHYSTPTISDVTFDVASLVRRMDDEVCTSLQLGSDKCDDNWGVQSFVDSLSDDHFSNGTLNATIAGEIMFAWLRSVMKNKMAMVNNISDAITLACETPFDELNLTKFHELYYAGDSTRNASLPDDFAFSSVYGFELSYNYSVARIPADVSGSVAEYDARLSSALDEWNVFRDNVDQLSNDYSDNSQYFATLNGVFRIWPGRETGKDDSGEYIYYDPRLRGWYVKATSGSANIVILMDLSNSMVIYDRFDTEKDFISQIIQTVGQNTKIVVVGFSQNVTYSCFGDTFRVMTSDNADKLSTWVNNATGKGWTNFENAFNAAFDILGTEIANSEDGCNDNVILFFTDGYKNEGANPISIVKRRNDNISAVIHSITIGSDADRETAEKLSSETGGISMHFSESFSDNVREALLPFYLYQNYGRQTDTVVISDPFIGFTSNALMITVAKSVFHDSKFVGVIGIDVTMADISDAMGDTTIGYNSYYFFFDRDSGKAIKHPLYDTTSDAIADINDLEPDEFAESGIKEDMIDGTSGYRKINATISSSFGELGGYVLVESPLLYIWEPIPDTALAMCVVIYTDDDIEPPFVPDFGFETAPEYTCDTNYSDVSADLVDCVYPFNMICRLDLIQSCDLSYFNESGIEMNPGNLSFFDGILSSVDYACWHAPPGLWDWTSDVTTFDPTCDELEALFAYTTNTSDVSTADLPWGGFRMNVTLHNIQIMGVLQEIWAPFYLIDDDNIVAIWVATFDGLFYVYPAQTVSSDYDPHDASWYKTAMAYPDYFSFSTPYLENVSIALVIDISTVVYDNNRMHSYAVTGFTLNYNEFLDWIGDTLFVCDNPTDLCYLIDFGAGVVYFEGIFWVGKDDVSSLFFGNLEPTIMQDFLEKGLFKSIQYSNFEDESTTQSYLHDYDIYTDVFSGNLTYDQYLFKFARNDGYYSVHWLEGTNLYLVYIEDYAVTTEYPTNCPASDCINVVSPGCITDGDGNCDSAFVDVCIEPDTLTSNAGLYCSNNSIAHSGDYIASLKDALSTDMCAEFSMGVRLDGSYLSVGMTFTIMAWIFQSH